MFPVMVIVFFGLVAVAFRRDGLRRQAPFVVAWVAVILGIALEPFLHAALASVAHEPHPSGPLGRFLGFVVLIVTAALASVAWDEHRTRNAARADRPSAG